MALGLAVGLCFPTASAQDIERISPYIKYLKVSGLQAQVKLIPKALFASLPADAFGDVKTKNKVEKAFYGKVDSDKWLHLVGSEIADVVGPETIDELVRFYSSRVGRKLAAANEIALNVWNLQKLRESHSRVSTLSETRLALLKKLGQSLDLELFNIASVEAVVQGILEGYFGNSERFEITNEHTKEIFRHSTKVARARSGELVLVSLANSLNLLSDEELSNVSSFLESEGSREARLAYRKALRKLLHDAGYLLGQSMWEASVDAGGRSPLSR